MGLPDHLTCQQVTWSPSLHAHRESELNFDLINLRSLLNIWRLGKAWTSRESCKWVFCNVNTPPPFFFLLLFLCSDDKLTSFGRQIREKVYIFNWSFGISLLNFQRHSGTGSASLCKLTWNNYSFFNFFTVYMYIVKIRTSVQYHRWELLFISPIYFWRNILLNIFGREELKGVWVCVCGGGGGRGRGGGVSLCKGVGNTVWWTQTSVIINILHPNLLNVNHTVYLWGGPCEKLFDVARKPGRRSVRLWSVPCINVDHLDPATRMSSL